MPKPKTPALADYRVLFTDLSEVAVRASALKIYGGSYVLEDTRGKPLLAARHDAVVYVKLLTDEDRQAAPAPDPVSPAAEKVAGTGPSGRRRATARQAGLKDG